MVPHFLRKLPLKLEPFTPNTCTQDAISEAFASVLICPRVQVLRCVNPMGIMGIMGKIKLKRLSGPSFPISIMGTVDMKRKAKISWGRGYEIL